MMIARGLSALGMEVTEASVLKIANYTEALESNVTEALGLDIIEQ